MKNRGYGMVKYFTKRLTVIIPGYNTPDCWWQRCISSVLNAIGPTDEVILVDDGSKLPVELSRLGFNGDSRISVLRKENGGLSSARNAALEVAKGKYVAFVDSDDCIEASAYENSIQMLEQHAQDICIFGVRTIWTSENLMKIDRAENKIYGYLQPQCLKVLLSRCLFNYAWNKVYRRSFLECGDIPLRYDFDGMPCEDTIFNLSCIVRGARWCSVDCVGYTYYRTNGSLLSTYKPSNIKGEIAGSEAWRNYKMSSQNAREVLGAYGETSERELLNLEWRNIWQPKSPYSLVNRWRWLKRNPKLGGGWMFFRTAIFVIIRRYLYFRPIRRWRIKHIYPHVVNYSERRR